MSVQAVHKGICGKCGDFIVPGDDIEAGPHGWGHARCPEDFREPEFDDRPRCRYCGDLLTPDFECESCPG